MENTIDESIRINREHEQLKDCAILIQGILSHGNFIVETPDESALVKAMEIAGYPITVDQNNRDSDFDFKEHKTFVGGIIDRGELYGRKCLKLKQLLLLTDPVVSNATMGDTQRIQWTEFIKCFPDES